MCRTSSFFIVFLVYVAMAKTDNEYRFDYTYNKEAEGWLKFHHTQSNFKDAFLRCNLEGAVLASPLNDNIQKAMVDLLAAYEENSAIYTGIHATISKGDFTSIEGVPLAKIPLAWAQNEPDNFDNEEDCIIMTPKGTVADARCNETYPYICYRKKITDPVITACGTVDTDYNLDERTGSCYKFHHIGKTWRRAQMTCLAEGGHLAIINSVTEAIVLQELFATKPPSAIIQSSMRDVLSVGFMDWDKRGSWFTVNGQSLKDAGYTSWANGQPDNDKTVDGGQHCGGMFRTGLLDDLWCESVSFAFICEKTPDSLIDDSLKSVKQI